MVDPEVDRWRRLLFDPKINVFQVVLDDEQQEYEALKDVLKEKDQAWFARHPQVLLLFVAQFMRREVFKRGRLWKDLWPSIGLPENSQTGMYDEIENALRHMGIKVIREDIGGRRLRLFVETFWREIGITNHNVGKFLDVFWWYYDNYYPENEFTEELFKYHRYYEDFVEQMYLIFEAVDKLIAIVELLQGSDVPLVGDMGDEVSEIKKHIHLTLGFDPLQILPSERYIIEVYNRCLNFVIPSKFKQLVGQKKGQSILTPLGKWLPGHVILADDNLVYGEYLVDGKTYRVTPHPKINPDDVTVWPLGELSYPLPCHVGYRSKKSFFVRKNDTEYKAVECYSSGTFIGYVWFGRIPVGGLLVIDGKTVPPLEGIQWQPMLKLKWPDVKRGWGPGLYIELGTVRVNLERLRGVDCQGKLTPFLH